ncbi:MAG: hypothetical protein HGN29_12485 [Asgard group archaeon]|nr:hypothetical protein [Asgard group archaeon]
MTYNKIDDSILDVSFFEVLIRPRTYSNLLYLFLLFPLSLFYFIWAVTVGSVSLGLIFTIVGFFLLYIFLWSLPRLMYGIGFLTKVLVGVEMPVVYKPHVEGGFFTKAFNALKDRRIATALFYSLFIALPFGTFVFSLMISLISTALALIASPFVALINWAIVGNPVWFTEAFSWAPQGVGIVLTIVAFIAGLALLPASLHISNRLAILHAKVIRWSLIR